jgi:hypothetical protein
VDVVIIGFFAAEITRWKMKRFTFVDKHIKGKLTKIKKKGVWIVFSFQVVEYGVPTLLFATTFVPVSIPGTSRTSPRPCSFSPSSACSPERVGSSGSF